ncbi:hypothetical protein LLEC1_07276 [Akanthomyces lecanii]|uniref:Uncharacterized protein n=1 Tax=Cordyceps confragosa TaxID=2714763 RepID=A0A179I9X2_CORDF|nr:hypothetical protein LLEC1_07276 [Akanthomyces lecanii]
MGILLAVHHVGTLLLLVTAILLLVASISSPVVNNLSLLNVKFRGGLDTDRVTFGSFGYCQMFDIVHHRVNEIRGNHATYGGALWCVVAALITSFFATVIVFLSCCASKRSKNKPRDTVHKQEAGFADSTVPKRKFWQRR